MLQLKLLPGTYAVCRLEAGAAVPRWAWGGGLSSVTRTDEELSIICPEARVPAGVRSEKGWCCVGIQGPLPFSLTGVLASVVDPLAKAGISLFAFSTYDTDYILVKDADLARARTAWTGAGHDLSP